jgi:tetratricopeptide (TPR) repeat protein
LACVALAVPWSGACANIDKAVSDYKAGRTLEAAAQLQSIVDREPGYAYGHFLLGHCMLKMLRPGDAEVDFRRALAIDPTRSEYYQGLALALKAQADWSHAVQAASDGLSRVQDPKERYALLALRGYAWGALERWEEAARDLAVARRMRPEPWVCLLLGKAYVALQDYPDAIVPLQQALQATPDDPSILKLLADSLVRAAGDESIPERKHTLYAEALSYAQRLAATRPDDVDAVHLLGRAALGAGQLAQAERVFLHVLSLDHRQCYAMVNLGRTYMALARWSEAETFLLQAAACAPRLAVVYETIGDLYMKTGMPQQAAVAYRRAEEIEPGAPSGRRLVRPRDDPATTPVKAPK